MICPCSLVSIVQLLCCPLLLLAIQSSLQMYFDTKMWGCKKHFNIESGISCISWFEQNCDLICKLQATRQYVTVTRLLWLIKNLHCIEILQVADPLCATQLADIVFWIVLTRREQILYDNKRCAFTNFLTNCNSNYFSFLLLRLEHLSWKYEIKFIFCVIAFGNIQLLPFMIQDEFLESIMVYHRT